MDFFRLNSALNFFKKNYVFLNVFFNTVNEIISLTLIWLVLLWVLVRMHTLSSDWCYWALVRMHTLSFDWCYYEHWWECICSHLTGSTISTGENAYGLIWLVLLWALVRMHKLSSDWCYYERWWECISSRLTGSTMSTSENA